MKNFLEKHWAVIVFILTALIDANQGFLESLLHEQWQIVLVRVIGSLILAYKWNPSINQSVLKVSASVADDTSDPIRSEHPKTRH